MALPGAASSEVGTGGKGVLVWGERLQGGAGSVLKGRCPASSLECVGISSALSATPCPVCPSVVPISRILGSAVGRGTALEMLTSSPSPRYFSAQDRPSGLWEESLQ